MSNFRSWGDFFKFATDILDEGYVYDKNYLVKLKTKAQDKTTEYALKVDQSKPGENGESKNAVEVKYKYANNGITQEGKLKNSGKATFDTEFDIGHFNDAAKGLTFHLDAEFANGKTFDTSAFSSGFTFANDTLEHKLYWDHGRSGTIEHEHSIKPRADSDILVGGAHTFDYKNPQLTNNTVGTVGTLSDNFHWGLKHEHDNGFNLGDLTLYTLQDVNADTKVATQVGYSHGDKTLNATAGFSHNLGDGSSYKAKITSAGLFGVSWAHQFNNGTTLTLSSAVDLGEKKILNNNPHPLGISLEGKF